ncbi:MAG TPA: haloalkane dehalogenase [Caulobacter sp.]|nr:haloalkane dehalogenase [Caulobacter sp.]
MQVLRTPEAHFEGLPDFPFPPRYAEVAAPGGQPLRLAYVEEGPADAAPVLLMHGEPSWSYLYRHIIPRLSRHRVLAPDLIGFGRSDKPADKADYSYETHVAWMSDWLVQLDLRDITLFCQDWGGLIGLRLVAAFPERFARVIVANTGLPTGSGMTEGFKQWLEVSQSMPVFPAGAFVNMGSVRTLSEEEIAAYDAPFPDESYKTCARAFPTFVPVTPEHPSVVENKAAWAVLERFDKPFLTAFSDADPVTRGGDRAFQERIPGAKGQPHLTIEGGGHFLQEDRPAEIADLINRFIGENP